MQTVFASTSASELAKTPTKLKYTLYLFCFCFFYFFCLNFFKVYLQSIVFEWVRSMFPFWLVGLVWRTPDSILLKSHFTAKSLQSFWGSDSHFTEIPFWWERTGDIELFTPPLLFQTGRKFTLFPRKSVYYFEWYLFQTAREARSRKKHTLFLYWK